MQSSQGLCSWQATLYIFLNSSYSIFTYVVEDSKISVEFNIMLDIQLQRKLLQLCIASIYNNQSMQVQDIKLVPVSYVCGNRKCGRESNLKPNDAVKCTFCAYRILYKKRNINLKQPVQYEAI